MILLRKSDDVTFDVVVLGYVSCFTNGGACIDVDDDDDGDDDVVDAVAFIGDDTVVTAFFGVTSFIYTCGVKIKLFVNQNK